MESTLEYEIQAPRQTIIYTDDIRAAQVGKVIGARAAEVEGTLDMPLSDVVNGAIAASLESPEIDKKIAESDVFFAAVTYTALVSRHEQRRSDPRGASV